MVNSGRLIGIRSLESLLHTSVSRMFLLGVRGGEVRELVKSADLHAQLACERDKDGHTWSAPYSLPS